MSPTRVIIVDDEALFRELLSRTLSGEPGIEVVGVAEDGASSIELSADLRPDAVLMDIELPGEMDGIAAALKIKEHRPETGIVMLSSHADRRYVTSLPLGESPGWSYMLKQSVPDIATLVRAVHGTASGMVMVDPAVMAGIKPREGSSVWDLTPRQQEVLALIAQGYNNGAIAQYLTIETKSVETYINGIYRALGVAGEPEMNARVKATLEYLRDS